MSRTTRPSTALATLAIALCAVALLAVAGAAPARQPPKRVAISPVAVNWTDDSAIVRRARVADSTILAIVTAQGFATVPADSVAALRTRVVDSMGGIFDPASGAVDTVKRARLDSIMHAQLAERFGADLWLRSAIGVEVVGFDGAWVQWRGAKEASGGLGGVGAFLLGKSYGKIPVLSFFAYVDDRRDSTVFYGSGGIQLLRKIKSNKLVPVPESSILADPSTIAFAVHRALDSLAARVGVEQRIAER